MTMTQTSRISRRARVAVWAPDGAAADRGIWVHGARYGQAVEGPLVFAAVLQAMGVPQPSLMAWLTIVIELAGGPAVLLGAFVPFVSVPLAAVLIVAMVKVHLPVRIQLDQAPRNRPGRCSIRRAGLRNQSALSRLSRHSRSWRSGARGD